MTAGCAGLDNVLGLVHKNRTSFVDTLTVPGA